MRARALWSPGRCWRPASIAGRQDAGPPGSAPVRSSVTFQRGQPCGRSRVQARQRRQPRQASCRDDGVGRRCSSTSTRRLARHLPGRRRLGGRSRRRRAGPTSAVPQPRRRHVRGRHRTRRASGIAATAWAPAPATTTTTAARPVRHQLRRQRAVPESRRRRASPTSRRAAARWLGRCWSTSCAFVDFDRDGDLDLFVTNYVDVGARTEPVLRRASRADAASTAIRSTTPPLPNVLYRNNGNGTFTDVSAARRHRGCTWQRPGRRRRRLRRRRLARMCSWPTTRVPNFLFHNEGERRFTERRSLAGVAVAADGKAARRHGHRRSATTTATAASDLVVTNHEFEMHSLFRNLGERAVHRRHGRERRRAGDAALRRLRRRVRSTTTTTADSTSPSSTAT